MCGPGRGGAGRAGWGHGQAGLDKAVRASEILFGAEIEQLSEAELGEIFADVPSRVLNRGRIDRCHVAGGGVIPGLSSRYFLRP